MCRRHRLAILTVLGLLMAATFAQPPAARAQAVTRFSAKFQNSHELATSVGPGAGGLNIYGNSVSVPANINTLFITITGAGDTQGNPSTQLLLGCAVDGTPCVSTNFATNASPANWANVLVDGSNTDSEDHSFSYTWCVPIKKHNPPNPLEHEVSINMASSDGTNGVFIERTLVTIDGSKIKGASDACTGF